MTDPPIDKKKQGRLNRARGARHELKVRKFLQDEGWVVDKFGNNVDLEAGEIIKAKTRFFRGRPLGIGVGFPDFIAFKKNLYGHFSIIGVECKTNGTLSKLEKQKLQWYLEHKIFSFLYTALNENKKIVFREFTGY